MRNLDTNLLRAFVAVAETGNITRAAGQMNLTQAAVSLQLKRLEETFTHLLFARGPRGLTLTPAGERLLPQARNLLHLNDEIWTGMTAPEYEGEVALGVPHDIVGSFLPPILRSFDRAWPRAQLRLVCNNTSVLLHELESGTIDLMLSTLQAAPRGAELLVEERLVWVGAPGGRAHLSRPLPLVFCGACAFKGPVTDVLDQKNLPWRLVGHVFDMPAEVAMIEADLGVCAFMARTMPKGLVTLGTAQGLPTLPRFSIFLHLPSDGGTPLARELAAHLRKGIAACPPAPVEAVCA